MEHACDFDWSHLYSDEGPPIGEAAGAPWVVGRRSSVEVASEIAAWVLRWN